MAAVHFCRWLDIEDIRVVHKAIHIKVAIWGVGIPVRVRHCANTVPFQSCCVSGIFQNRREILALNELLIRARDGMYEVLVIYLCACVVCVRACNVCVVLQCQSLLAYAGVTSPIRKYSKRVLIGSRRLLLPMDITARSMVPYCVCMYIVWQEQFPESKLRGAACKYFKNRP